MYLRRIVFAMSFCSLLLFSACEKTLTGSGWVMDKNTGLPIQNATVDVYLDHPSPDAFQMRTQTNVRGEYVVNTDPQVCTGSCPDLYVEISKEGYKGTYVKNPHNDTTYLEPLP